MNEFMKDRYGVDELATLMGGAGVLLALIGTIADLDPLTWLALAIILLALARAFSKNVGARRRENESFRAFAAKVPGLRAIVERMGGASPAGAGASTGAKAAAEMCIRDRSLEHRNGSSTSYSPPVRTSRRRAIPRSRSLPRMAKREKNCVCSTCLRRHRETSRASSDAASTYSLSLIHI